MYVFIYVFNYLFIYTTRYSLHVWIICDYIGWEFQPFFRDSEQLTRLAKKSRLLWLPDDSVMPDPEVTSVACVVHSSQTPKVCATNSQALVSWRINSVLCIRNKSVSRRAKECWTLFISTTGLRSLLYGVISRTQEIRWKS